MCFSRCAIGNQTQAIAVATAARTPQIIPAVAPKTRSIPTITIGLTSPPDAKLSTATIPAPTTTPIPARIKMPLGVFMRTTLHYKAPLSQARWQICPAHTSQLLLSGDYTQYKKAPTFAVGCDCTYPNLERKGAPL